MREQNALIESASFDTERGLSAWIHVKRQDGWNQGFGGYLLYTPSSWGRPGTPKKPQYNYAGHWIWRVLEIAGVSDWSKLPGRTIRIRDSGKYNDPIEAIGHIIKDDWFCPREDFGTMEETGQLPAPKPGDEQ
jgi:hypothetical protein